MRVHRYCRAADVVNRCPPLLYDKWFMCMYHYCGDFMQLAQGMFAYCCVIGSLFM